MLKLLIVLHIGSHLSHCYISAIEFFHGRLTYLTANFVLFHLRCNANGMTRAWPAYTPRSDCMYIHSYFVTNRGSQTQLKHFKEPIQAQIWGFCFETSLGWICCPDESHAQTWIPSHHRGQPKIKVASNRRVQKPFRVFMFCKPNFHFRTNVRYFALYICCWFEIKKLMENSSLFSMRST